MPWLHDSLGHLQPCYWQCRKRVPVLKRRKISSTCTFSLLKNGNQWKHAFMIHHINSVGQWLSIWEIWLVGVRLNDRWNLSIYLLLLISMLWHRQAIFKSKGDKLCSSAEGRIWTRGPRHQIASRLNARWQTDWAIEDQAKKLELDRCTSSIPIPITGHSTVCLTAYTNPRQRNIKVRITGPFCGEFTGDRWIPHTKGQ